MLVAGIVTSAALVAVSGLGVAGPRIEGELELARVAGEVSDAAFGEWSRLRREPTPCDAVATVRWSRADEDVDLAPTVAQPVEDEPVGRDDGAARALLAEALRPPRNEERLRETLETLAEFDLGAELAVELAVQRRRAGLPSPAPTSALGATWRGLPVPIAVALASGEERADERTALADAWAHGELAFESPSWTFATDPPTCTLDSRERALLERLLTPEQCERVMAMSAPRALAAALGGWPTLMDDERWRVQPLPSDAEGWTGLARVQAGDMRELSIVAREAPLRAVSAALARAGLVPDGFALRPSDEPGAGDIVRAAESTEGLTFVVTHADAAAFVARAGDRVIWLRNGLLVLAIAILVTALFLARALRRDRRLIEARSAFVASVSHELRTPVASILTLSENLERGHASARSAKRYPGLIHREAERLRRLVDDVLDMSRIERGQLLKPRLAETETRPWLDEVLLELEKTVAGAGRAFQSDSAELPEHVFIDAELMRRALGNLVDNAVKHGQDRVTLTTGVGADERWWVSVSDEGLGVPRPARQRVFESFERLGRNDGRGAGLGLGIVRQIVTAHGGQVAFLDPADGHGAHVRLELPVHVEPNMGAEA